MRLISRAVQRPVKPPPMMHTSARCLPCSSVTEAGTPASWSHQLIIAAEGKAAQASETITCFSSV